MLQIQKIIHYKKQNNPTYYGYILNKFESQQHLLELYDQDKLDFDFEKRMNINYEISKEKESECDIKIIDFIELEPYIFNLDRCLIFGN